MAGDILDLSGNIVVAAEFRGNQTAGTVTVGEITVEGTTVGPGSLEEVLAEVLALINTKADDA